MSFYERSGSSLPHGISAKPELQTERSSIEPERKFDYSFWEKQYNRKLSDVEKIEIESNIKALLGLLKAEYERRRGA